MLSEVIAAIQLVVTKKLRTVLLHVFQTSKSLFPPQETTVPRRETTVSTVGNGRAKGGKQACQRQETSVPKAGNERAKGRKQAFPRHFFTMQEKKTAVCPARI